MKKTVFLMTVVVFFALPVWVRADGGAVTVLTPHPVAAYPGAVRESAGGGNVLLSKDDVEAVKRFYEAHRQAGDRIEALPADDGGRRYRLFYAKVIDGKELSVTELSFAARPLTRNMHPALGELKAQAMMGKHSEAEFQAMEKEYLPLSAAFYRQVDDGGGRLVSEGEQIYRKARVSVDADEQAAGKARAQDMRRQMQEMKARGDIAGIMELAQRSGGSPRQTKAGAAMMDGMEKETWDIWAACLRELKAAAYWTRLEYHASVLPGK